MGFLTMPQPATIQTPTGGTVSTEDELVVGSLNEETVGELTEEGDDDNNKGRCCVGHLVHLLFGGADFSAMVEEICDLGEVASAL